MDRDSTLIFEAYLRGSLHRETTLKKGTKVQIINTPFMKQAFPKEAGKQGEIINVGVHNDFLIQIKGIDEPAWWFVNDFRVVG